MQGNRFELKNPAGILSAVKKNSHFNAFSNLVSVSNRANELSPVGEVKYLEQNSDGGGTIKLQAIK